MSKHPLLVCDVLKRKHFESAKLIAGQQGLNRQVLWTHILEIKNFDTLINGGELILTTGVGLQLERETQIAYLQNLIRNGAAALCIEIGDYFDYVPVELVALANAHDFPIIIFEEVVRFIDITQDLHTYIINQHQQALTQLDTISKTFMELSLMPNGILKILQVLYQDTDALFLFVSEDTKSFYYPIEAKKYLQLMEDHCQQLDLHEPLQLLSIDKDYFVIIPVNGLGQVWGYLCMHSLLPKPSDYTLLNLERATMSIAQILMRNRMLQERQQSREDEFILSLIQGQPIDLQYYQSYLPKESRNLFYRVVVFTILDYADTFTEEDWQEIQLQNVMFVRSILKKLGFFPTVSVRQHEIIILAFYIAADDMEENRDPFNQAVQQIIARKTPQLFEQITLTFGISNVYHSINSVHQGYKEAKTTIQMQHNELASSIYYKDLGVYRLLLHQNHAALLQYVKDYLQEILLIDQKNGNDLYQTLCVYLACNGAKNDTAEQLFIVRQTLYKRIERLENILGADFLQAPHRLNIEIAVKAYELLKKTAPDILRF
ncbi:PucR family transcriptional regulator ligand-binding domain-containing protein [Lysinibacillus xylanilyticus]|uniref:PucR family transcriptional regulator n=1 Tax=Lysinibacillus xylanilyticus TaxID=582475 RepID=UPI002B2547E3|nr:PucR family transcriptional regulator ligand-binding domain-containing protein [Lysinibacillus xylanilyticus]MEB2299245.1 PucR family transcriptional regulator ligand-binding domain-containing protein [Lysinibacillus xylanilyticus]